ncbi:MAG: hypothetical protein E7240_01470 [Lachnospiraceae bacterium]|nr:hypothetical protein [Lachnospiraceae bacterium]
MDKEEYRIRLESIRTLAAQQDFSAAAQVADTVDWKRVKSVRTLCMIAEIYEAAEQPEDAKKVLQFAYWRAHDSKTVLYRLTEINIKTGDFQEALKYCDEFELLSPKDETRYLLRYRLLTARRDPLESRIRLLENYRETRFTEKWAYELALLYRENGQEEKCVQLLDDMIVWFPDGKYQDKARALRDQVRKNAPEEKPAPEARITDTVEIKPEMLRRRPEKPIAEDAFRRTEDSAVKTQLADSWRTLVSGIRTGEIQIEVPENVLTFPEDDEPETGYVRPDPKNVKALEPETIGRTTIAPPTPDARAEDGVQITIDDYMNGSAPSKSGNELDELLSETSAHLASAVASGRYDRIRTEDTAGEEEALPYGQMSFEDFMPELQDETADESGEKDAAGDMDPLTKLYGKETDETLGLTKSYSLERDVVKEIANQEKKKASDEEEKRRRKAVAQTLRSAGVITEEIPETEQQTQDHWNQDAEAVSEADETAEKSAAEEIVAEADDAGESVSEAKQSIEEMLREAEEDDEPVVRVPRKKKRADFGGWLGKILRGDAEDDDDFREEEDTDAAETDQEMSLPEEKEIGIPEEFPVKPVIDTGFLEEAAEEVTGESPEEAEDTAGQEETGAEDAAVLNESAEEETAGPEETAAEEETEVQAALQEEENTDGEDFSEEEPVRPAKKTKKKGGLFAFLNALRLNDEDDFEEEEEEDVPAAETVSEEAGEDEASVQTAEITPDEEEKEAEGASEAEAADDLTWIDEWKAAAEESAQETERAMAAEEEETPAEPSETEAAAAEEASSEVFPEETEEETDSTQTLIEAIASSPEVMKRLPVEPRPFDDTEKEIFSYFTRVPGMSEQITMALSDVHNNAGDKTSRSGNIMVIGRQGAGKTHLTDAIMTAVCRDLGIHATRCAKIIASEFNEKNPAEVVSKLMGGFLVIEGAGELNDDAVEKLLRAMEFRTDHLVVMLEDEKADLKALLLRHPEIEDKFTSTIVIPVFTNDELVTFAKAYAKEKGYRMDEMGILALYTMIGDNQSATEPVTVGKVREMMDAAIEKADSGARRIGRRFSKKSVDKDGRILLREKDFDI